MKRAERSSSRKHRRTGDLEQLALWKPRGGKRRGAGRPPKGKRAGSPHKERPALNPRYPVHVVLRVVAAVGNLRRRCTYQAVREATITTARREDFRIVHLSIQRTHIHLLVEADDQHALARGMQGFQISAAKQLNAAIRRTTSGSHRKGTVFPDRYHAEIITSPRQARHCLSYVLSNFRKHKEDCKAPMSSWRSTGFRVRWRSLGGPSVPTSPETVPPRYLCTDGRRMVPQTCPSHPKFQVEKTPPQGTSASSVSPA